MSFNNLHHETKENISFVTINRPKQLNALNKETIAELNALLSHIENQEDIRCVIITGAGEKAFIAGADIKEFANFSKEEGKELAQTGHTILFDKVAHFSKPVIAAINGFALGGGLELALASHIRIASENAKMGLPEVTLGLIPGYGGTQRLAQIVGKGKAMEIILSAQMIDANTAKNIQLVNEVVPQNELLEHCKKLAQKISFNAPNAITNAITAINNNYDHTINGLEKEIELFGNCFDTKNFKEGVSAFLEKRKPQF